MKRKARKQRQLIIIVMLFAFTSFVTNYLYRATTVYASSTHKIYTHGSSGGAVRKIQERLKNWGYYFGEENGVYGTETYEAVKFFQQRNDLKIDGIAGPKTLEAIGLLGYMENTETVVAAFSSNSTPNPTQNSTKANSTIESLIAKLPASTISSRESDVWLLACIINGEGRGESYLGQVAIGAVVMNRVNHPSFPNTISGVIFQPGAFDAVRDGQVNLIPSESCINAARDALNGWDPVDGALYYWNPEIATSKWVLTLTTIKSIGNHTFAVN